MNGIQQHGHQPDPRRILAAFEAEAQVAVREARVAALAAARAGAPGSFGGPNMYATGRRTVYGWEITVGIRPKVRWRAIFPEGGTGIYGPTGRPIHRKTKDRFGRPKPFYFQGHTVPQIRGQRGQHFMARNRPVAVEAMAVAITAGMRRAGQKAAKL